MASTEKRGKTAREAVLEYCTFWTQGLYLGCWPTKGPGDATMEVMEATSRAASDEMMAILRHEIPEQDDTASVSEQMGGDNESDLASAAWQGFDPKFPDPARFNEPAPVPLWVEGRPGKGMPRREVTQDELRHLRLYPERDELSGGGLKFVGLLFFNAAERLPVDEMKGSDNAAADPKERRDTQAAEAASTPAKADQAQTDDEPKTSRKRDAEAEATLRTRIEMVVSMARRIWKNPEKRPPIDVMAKQLADLHSKKLGYKFETIRKILSGTYGPQERLKITGL